MPAGGDHGADGFWHEQRRVGLGAACAAGTSVLVILLLVVLRPFGVPDLPDAASRVAFAVRTDLFVVAWLGVMVASVAQRRFFSAEDIGRSATGPGGAGLGRADVVLQNTLEQVVFAVGCHVGLASVLPGWFMVVVPGLVGLFWLGYRDGAGLGLLGLG